jgi:hypothetical protein
VFLVEVGAEERPGDVDHDEDGGDVLLGRGMHSEVGRVLCRVKALMRRSSSEPNDPLDDQIAHNIRAYR